MDIEWGIFLPAMVLLYYPADRIFPADLRLRTYSQLSDPARRHLDYWWRWQPALWVDTLRIGAAVWLVHFSMSLAPLASKTQSVVSMGVLLMVGVIPQMVTRRKRDAMFAPIGYVLATLFVLLPFSAALPAAVLGVVGLMALREFSAIFLGGAVMSLVLGYLLGRSLVTACMVAAIFALPAVLGTMFRCKLVLPVRSQGEYVPPAPPR